MRVKMSYGIQIEKVPRETRRLIDIALEDLRASIKDLERASAALEDCESNFHLPISYLDKTRKRLTESDTLLSDSHSILLGLDNYYNGEQDVSEGRSTVDSSGNTIAQTESTREG
tara:strand:+ start:801 stop:1145 length:345 start_codon:yes stop_codon:yes gene_type:complete